MSENKPTVIPATESKLCATVNFNWFLKDAEKFENGTRSQPVPATFKALVNGKEAFEELHNRIEKAKSCIDIAIWGFQPSMHFKRDGESPCIGDLLIQKALEGVKVRILVWSMWGNIQTFQEANLGNRPGALKGREKGVTREQANYDRYWFEAIRGWLDEEVVNLQGSIRQWEVKEIEKYPQLLAFSKSPKRTKLVYKTRRVAPQKENFKPRVLPDGTKVNHSFEDITLPDGKGTLLDGSYDFALKNFKSHHQKTVLIDYDRPELAVGFVLEHNMVDNYWDDNDHSLKTAEPNKGKNSPTPLQDVSSIVTGQVLWDINHNFCQSWDRKNKQWGNDAVERDLTTQRSAFTRENYKPNPSLVEDSQLLMAQIVRTYDDPDIEDIMKVYLKNIKQTTSYLYTENQYFRFPPLVREFIAHWERLKNCGRAEGPIHWFTVTNSSDSGLGDGTYTTNEMFKLLGKQDVMPNVAREIKLDELGVLLGKEKRREARLYENIGWAPTKEGRAVATAEFEKNQQEIRRIEKEMAEIKAKRKQEQQKNKEAEQAQNTSDKTQDTQIENQELSKEDANLTKELGYEFSDTPGIKAHICTLMPKDENGNYVHRYKDKSGKELPAEVYVHSKVTIMDDVFTVISSANLNTRSMQVDTELGIIMECNEVAEGLRKRLWDLHTNKNGAANPDDMHDYEVAVGAFDQWLDLINKNKQAKKKNENPTCALREFYRADPTVSKSD
ncbi:phospholipase D-like domain-containing protein [Aggregatibacter actinomycetemcomitans]|uniref:phospholipase D-like domain-containing protein n=6 Tax=Aggregatibacter actinomycetemcomitans TaxID=714 RepID=UPI00215A8DE6|nr:phospholipase D-like domain-containing protein [Aggregatibacter actinomycetemcomitans]